MAQSRLERIGTIFSRVTSLMKGGAMKPEDKPLWYVIYKAFPPKQEPRFDRAAPNIDIKDIFYKEDIIRAKFHEDYGKKLKNSLLKDDQPSATQNFIAIYQDLEKRDIPESELYDTAMKMFNEQNSSFQSDTNEKDRFEVEREKKSSIDLQEIFAIKDKE